MSEQVYVVTGHDLNSRDPQEVIGCARTYEAAVLIALEWFDSEDARVDTGDPMYIFDGWADACIETFDLVG